MNQVVSLATSQHANSAEYLIVTLGGHRFGVPVADIRDVLAAQPVTVVPLAPPRVAGLMNLRGRVVTAISPHRSLAMETDPAGARMFVVIAHHEELYGLMVDGVGDVARFDASAIEPNPPHINPVWRPLSHGIVQCANDLVVILNVARLIDHEEGIAA